MAQSDNRKRFLVESTGCAIYVIKSSLKFLRFFLFNPDFIGIVRADSFGGVAGGGRRAGAGEAEGRANQMKFDIFCKRPASKEKKAAKR